MSNLEEDLLRRVVAAGTLHLDQRSVIDLAKLLGTTSQGLAAAKNKLKKAGLITDGQASNNVIYVQATAAGRAAVP